LGLELYRTGGYKPSEYKEGSGGGRRDWGGRAMRNETDGTVFDVGAQPVFAGVMSVGGLDNYEREDNQGKKERRITTQCWPIDVSQWSHCFEW